MFFFSHPKPVSDRKEVAALVQQNKTAASGLEQVLIAKDAPNPKNGNKQEDTLQEVQKGDVAPPPA
jgi:hypothetical protein